MFRGSGEGEAGKIGHLAVGRGIGLGGLVGVSLWYDVVETVSLTDPQWNLVKSLNLSLSFLICKMSYITMPFMRLAFGVLDQIGRSNSRTEPGTE